MKLSSVADFIRWRDWGPGKIPVLCTILYYIGLTSRRLSAGFLVDVLLFIIYAASHSALGFVANDWGDRELDALHGKPNAFASLTRGQGMAAFAILLILAFLSGLPFALRPMVVPLWAGWAFFALAYSLRPLRFKERGVWGLAFSFVAQWSLPIMLAFAVLNRFGGYDMLVFVVSMTVSGATLEIAHQRWDRDRDLATQTGTLGTHASAAKLDRLYAAALVLDKLAWGAILVTFTVKIAPATIGRFALSPGLPLLAIYLVLFVAAIYETVRAAQRGELLDPYYSGHRSFSKLLHETMPNLVVPFWLIALATVYEPVNGLLLVTFLYWRLVLGQTDWRWPLRTLRDWWQKSKGVGAG